MTSLKANIFEQPALQCVFWCTYLTFDQPDNMPSRYTIKLQSAHLTFRGKCSESPKIAIWITSNCLSYGEMVVCWQSISGYVVNKWDMQKRYSFLISMHAECVNHISKGKSWRQIGDKLFSYPDGYPPWIIIWLC